MRAKGLLPLITLVLASCSVEGRDAPPNDPDHAVLLGLCKEMGLGARMVTNGEVPDGVVLRAG
jgi:hypothetical protein